MGFLANPPLTQLNSLIPHPYDHQLEVLLRWDLGKDRLRAPAEGSTVPGITDTLIGCEH